ncbi:MAG TPA: hypothetical protein VNM92_11065 [Thermoanaerobaculia bacterium]|nr:hypothetical protein [Thermoanaerobaculia bacterium]
MAGFAIGFALWWGATPQYNELVRRGAEPIVRLFEVTPATTLRLKGREVLIVKADLPRGTKRPGIPLYDLTFNVVLLMVLFAADRATFSNRNVVVFPLALLLLYCGHVFGLIAWINHILATDVAQGRVAEFSAFSRAFWYKAIYFYRTVGGLALAVGIWWLLRPQPLLGGTEEVSTPQPRPRRTKR